MAIDPHMRRQMIREWNEGSVASAYMGAKLCVSVCMIDAVRDVAIVLQTKMQVGLHLGDLLVCYRVAGHAVFWGCQLLDPANPAPLGIRVSSCVSVRYVIGRLSQLVSGHNYGFVACVGMGQSVRSGNVRRAS